MKITSLLSKKNLKLAALVISYFLVTAYLYYIIGAFIHERVGTFYSLLIVAAIPSIPFAAVFHYLFSVELVNKTKVVTSLQKSAASKMNPFSWNSHLDIRFNITNPSGDDFQTMYDYAIRVAGSKHKFVEGTTGSLSTDARNNIKSATKEDTLVIAFVSRMPYSEIPILNSCKAGRIVIIDFTHTTAVMLQRCILPVDVFNKLSSNKYVKK